MPLSNNPDNSTDQYFIMAVSVVGFLVLGELGIGALPLLALAALDAVDPYDYGQALTRDAINKIFDHVNQAKAQAAKNNQATGYATIRQYAPGLTDDQIAHVYELLIAPYMIHTKQPDPTKPDGCWSELKSTEAPRAAGRPGSNCDPVYKAAYDTYYNENEAKYTQENITDNNIMQVALKLSEEVEFQAEAKHERETYYWIIGATTVGMLLSIVLLLIFKNSI